MDQKTVKVPNISCHHCAMTIENELKEIKGVSEVKVEVPDKTVTVKWDDPANWKLISDLLTKINFPAAE